MPCSKAPSDTGGWQELVFLLHTGLWGPSYSNNKTNSLFETHISLESVYPLPAEPSQTSSQRKGVAFCIWWLSLPQCLLHFLSLTFCFSLLKTWSCCGAQAPSEHIPNPPNSVSWVLCLQECAAVSPRYSSYNVAYESCFTCWMLKNRQDSERQSTPLG